MSERDKRQEWETPDDFFGIMNAEFQFQIDVCATKKNAKCKAYIGIPGDKHSDWDDALGDISWLWPQYKIHRAWCNPGFANPGSWIEKAYLQVHAYDIPEAVVVVMALISPSTKWWRDWAMKASEIRLLGGRRIQFKAPRGVKQSSNARENCLIIFRPNPYNLAPRIWTWDWTEGLCQKPQEGESLR